MALEENSYIASVLIVLNPDGSFKAAHEETINIISKDGVSISESLLGAVAVTEEALSGILPDVASVYAQNMQLQQANTQLQHQIDDLLEQKKTSVEETE